MMGSINLHIRGLQKVRFRWQLQHHEIRLMLCNSLSSCFENSGGLNEASASRLCHGDVSSKWPRTRRIAKVTAFSWRIDQVRVPYWQHVVEAWPTCATRNVSTNDCLTLKFPRNRTSKSACWCTGSLSMPGYLVSLFWLQYAKCASPRNMTHIWRPGTNLREELKNE